MMLWVFPYFRGFLSVIHRLLALLAVAFFLAIVWFDFGASLNIPALLWHDCELLQASAGLSIGALFAYVWLVTYILDASYHPEFITAALKRSRRSLAFRIVKFAWPADKGLAGNEPLDLREGGDGLRWYLGATFVPCAFLLLISAFIVVNGTSPYIHFVDADLSQAGQFVIAKRWPFAVGVLSTLVVMRVVAWLGNLFRRVCLTTERRRSLAKRSWLQFVAGVLLVTLAVLYGLFCWMVRSHIWQPPPVTAVCMVLGLFVGVSGAIWFHLRLWSVPATIGLIAWLAYCNAPEYRLRFPHLTEEYAAVLRLEDFREPASVAEFTGIQANRESAQKAEVERIRRIVANVLAQGTTNRTADEIFSDLKKSSPEPKAEVKQQFDRVSRVVAKMLGNRKTKKPSSEFVADLERAFPSPASYSDLVVAYDIAQRLLELEETDALEEWKRQFAGKAKANRPKMVIVTATGGANRSALWTCKVLAELHEEFRKKGENFPAHLRIITGASGGMVGAAYYVGSVQSGGSLQAGFEPRDIAQDFLTPIINSFVFHEVPLLAIPTESYSRDRGEALDLAMEGEVPHIKPEIRERLKNVFGRSFAKWVESERKGWRPSMIFSPMIVEDGRRLFISNRHVPFLTVNKGDFLLPNRDDFGETGASEAGSAKLAKTLQRTQAQRRARVAGDRADVYSQPGLEFFRLFPDSHDRFRISTAARMNATFPFLSPAVSLPTDSARRIVDAGYYDNSGVSVAAAWLYQHADWISQNCSGVVLIQIRDFASHRENRDISLPDSDEKSVLPGLMSVVSAIAHARTSTANYRNDDDLRRLGDYFRMNGPAIDQFFTTLVFERYSETGMNWYLSESDKDFILDCWDKQVDAGNMNPASLQKLHEWWKNH